MCLRKKNKNITLEDIFHFGGTDAERLNGFKKADPFVDPTVPSNPFPEELINLTEGERNY